MLVSASRHQCSRERRERRKRNGGREEESMRKGRKTESEKKYE
jgi:hypothetical protein